GMLQGGAVQSCALVSGGVQCWGASVSSDVPVALPGLMAGVQAYAAGSDHVCAIRTGGAALCWGNGYRGAIGNNSTGFNWTAGPVTGLNSGVQAIAAGSESSCAAVNGGAMCWGYNNWGQLGDG